MEIAMIFTLVILVKHLEDSKTVEAQGRGGSVSLRIFLKSTVRKNY